MTTAPLPRKRRSPPLLLSRLPSLPSRVVARRPLPQPRPLPSPPPALSRRVLSPLSTAPTSARARPPTPKPSSRSPRRSAVARPRRTKSLLPLPLRSPPAQRRTRRRRRRVARASAVMLRRLYCPACYPHYTTMSGPLSRDTTRLPTKAPTKPQEEGQAGKEPAPLGRRW